MSWAGGKPRIAEMKFPSSDQSEAILAAQARQ